MFNFYHSHECSGYRAKITVEWCAPENIELLPERAAEAEAIADDAMAKLAPNKVMEIVQAMMGRR